MVTSDLRRLGDLCDFKPSKAEVRSRLNPNDLVSFVPMECLGQHVKSLSACEDRPLAGVEKSYTYFADNDVLLAKITPCFENGKLGIARKLTNGVGFGSSEFFVLRPCSILNSDYLYYFLARDEVREQGRKIMTGAVGHKRVPKEYIEELRIRLPGLNEQTRIVAILDEAFEGIDGAIANTERCLANVKGLFESYLNLVFRRGGPDWTTSTLGEVCTFEGGSQPPKSVFSKEAKQRYVRLVQIRDYKSDNHVVYIPREQARRFCDATDVMIGRYGPPLFQILRGLEGAYNVALMKAKPNEDVLTKEFLFYFLKNGDILQYIINASNRAAGQIGLNKATLEPYPIAYPSKAEQEAIVTTLVKRHEVIMRLQESYLRKLKNLNELKQSVLSKAFSGKLTVSPSNKLEQAAE